MEAEPGAAVVLLGAPGSGRSTLAAALLEDEAGSAPYADEPWQLASGAYERDGRVVTLLDAPGSPQLAGELAAALRVASAAVLVVSPVQGLDPRTVALWESVEHLPRLVVLTQLDRPGADADEAVALCQRLLGEGVLALHLPLHDDDGAVGGLLDLLTLTVVADGQERPADPEHVTLVEAVRGELVEAVLTGSEDESLLDRYLDDDEPGADVLTAELVAGVARGDVQPVLVVAPRQGLGLTQLAALLAAVPGAGADHGPAASAPDGGPARAGVVAEVVRGALVRVWSGTLRPGPVLVDGEPASHNGAPGPAGALVRAEVARPAGTVLSDAPVRLAPWSLRPAAFPVGAPDDKGLAARVRLDPVARLEADARTGQLLLWTYGPEHAEALLAGLPSSPVRVPPGARPVEVRVHVPSWCERPVRSDLLARGAELLPAGGEPADGERDDERGDEAATVLRARLPPSELAGYALALGRVSGWTGWFTRA